MVQSRVFLNKQYSILTCYIDGGSHTVTLQILEFVQSLEIFFQVGKGEGGHDMYAFSQNPVKKARDLVRLSNCHHAYQMSKNGHVLQKLATSDTTVQIWMLRKCILKVHVTFQLEKRGQELFSE